MGAALGAMRFATVGAEQSRMLVVAAHARSPVCITAHDIGQRLGWWLDVAHGAVRKAMIWVATSRTNVHSHFNSACALRIAVHDTFGRIGFVAQQRAYSDVPQATDLVTVILDTRNDLKW